jgi:hypothetical protein
VDGTGLGSHLVVGFGIIGVWVLLQGGKLEFTTLTTYKHACKFWFTGMGICLMHGI